MRRDDQCRILSDIMDRLLGTVLQKERSEATQVDILAGDQRRAHLLHELLHDGCDRHALNAG